jgi:antitoxin (DNA-binding transcriptional repressor) of toxin-antitoxin stability system
MMKDEAGEETRPLAERSNKMKTVTILELKAKAGELVRSVMRTGEEVQIIDNDEVVALLVSTDEAKKNEITGIWTTLEQLFGEIRSDR